VEVALGVAVAIALAAAGHFFQKIYFVHSLWFEILAKNAYFLELSHDMTKMIEEYLKIIRNLISPIFPQITSDAEIPCWYTAR
jgi:hypothetical protein